MRTQKANYYVQNAANYAEQIQPIEMKLFPLDVPSYCFTPTFELEEFKTDEKLYNTVKLIFKTNIQLEKP